MAQTVQQERRIHIIPATKPTTAPGHASGQRQRVAAYCRVSTDSEEQLTSYTAQALRKFSLRLRNSRIALWDESPPPKFSLSESVICDKI